MLIKKDLTVINKIYIYCILKFANINIFRNYEYFLIKLIIEIFLIKSFFYKINSINLQCFTHF